MAVDKELLALMPDTVVWTTGQSLSNYGTPTFASTGHSMAARISRKVSDIRAKDGTVVASQGTVWCAPSSPSDSFRPSPEDRLTLPDGTTPAVMDLEILNDEAELHHYKVTLGF